MKVGTKSVLYGAHCWAIHPWFVALAWTKLYGFPWDPRLWVAFAVHDLGYWDKPNMDGSEGESHVEFGAKIMHRLFDRSCGEEGCYDGHSRYWNSWDAEEVWYDCPDCHQWRNFCLYHSRFYARRDRHQFSPLCVADKLSVALEPWWLYLPRVIATGEIDEYMAIADGRVGSKYNGEPRRTDPSALIGLSPRRAWHRRMTNYLRDWAYVHRDCRPDTWTPEQAA